MLASHLKIALRHLATQKLYTAINVTGLAVGLACFVLIALFVANELGYDDGWSDADRIYRVSRDFFETARSTEAHVAGIAAPAGPLLEQHFPEIEAAARIFCCGAVVKSPDGDAVMERNYAEADNALFRIFDFQWISGNPATALTEPNHAVITQSLARRHFGDRDPMGRTLLFGGGTPDSWMSLEVVGVIADLPESTHLNVEMLGSLLSWQGDEGALRYFNDWGNNVFPTYIKLREGADIASVQDRSGDFFDRHLEEGASEYTGFTAVPIGDIHLRSTRENEMRAPGSIGVVYTFSAIATFVLLLACINFMNLSTARSTQRAKEIGVRKIAGAERWRVAAQFLGESVLLAWLSVLIAVMLVELGLPTFNRLFRETLEFDYLARPAVLGALALLAVVTGLLAGSYPALYLSAFAPSRVLKGDVHVGGSAAFVRKALVVTQFAISIALLIGTAVVYGQMAFVRGIELGYDKEHVIVVTPNNVESGQWETLRNTWLAHPAITHVTQSDLLPSEHNPKTAEIRAAGNGERGVRMQFVMVDFNFFETFDIGLLSGRTFSPEHGIDREADDGATPFVVNALAARRLGFTPDEAIGQRVDFGAVQGTRFRVTEASGPIVGVVDDVYFESVHNAIEPVVFRAPGGSLRNVSIKASGDDLEGMLAFIDSTWSEVRPDLPMTPWLLDRQFAELYAAEEQQARMFTFFSGLAVFVACLGLLGLAAFATEKRTKEIGVRKVMGGTVTDIVRLFAGEFGRLVLAANLVAWPVAYFAMSRWLDNFAYRIDMSLATFVGCALGALGLCLLTVGIVSVRAAAINPVQSLRYE